MTDPIEELKKLVERIGSTFTPFTLDSAGNRVYLTVEQVCKIFADELSRIIPAIEKWMKAGVGAERKRCADICQSTAEKWMELKDWDGHVAKYEAGMECAGLIRSLAPSDALKELLADAKREMFDEFWDAAATEGVPAGKYSPKSLVDAIRAEELRLLDERCCANPDVCELCKRIAELEATNGE